jgi:recombinational DNA repair protein RecT
VASWQIEWKGIVQLAHRTGQYKRINLARVYDGELVRHDRFKGIVELDESKRKSKRVQGYYFYFELLNGAMMEFYWSAKECVEHGLRYSKSFQKGNGRWVEDSEFKKAKTVNNWLKGSEHFLTEGSGADAMSGKTIVKNMLNKWGPLETRIKEIVSLDQAVIGHDGKPEYIDSTVVREGDADALPPKTYKAPPMIEKGKELTPTEKIDWVRDAAVKQGVEPFTFDAWVEAQAGTEADKAAAAGAAWKTVTANKATAAEAFKLEAKTEAPSEPKGEKPASIKILATAKTEFKDENAYVIKAILHDGTEVKVYTKDKTIRDAAESIKETDKTMPVILQEVMDGKSKTLWIVTPA